MNILQSKIKIIYYIGRCALYHTAIKIVLKLDNKQVFKFSPLSLPETNQKEFPYSIILKFNNKLYYESEVVRKILGNLNFFGKTLSFFTKITPLKLLNPFTRLLLKVKVFRLWKMKINVL